MEDRHLFADLGLLGPELRYVAAYRSLQVNQTLVDEPQKRRRREGLCRGAHLEQRGLVDRERVLRAGHSGERIPLLPVDENAHGDTRDAELGGQSVQLVLQLLTHEHSSGGSVARRGWRPRSVTSPARRRRHRAVR